MASLVETLKDLKRIKEVPTVLPIPERDWPTYVTNILLNKFPNLKDIEFFYVMDECQDEVRCSTFTTDITVEDTFDPEEYLALIEIISMGHLENFEYIYIPQDENGFGSSVAVNFRLDVNPTTKEPIFLINTIKHNREYQTDRQMLDLQAVYNLFFINEVDKVHITISVDVSMYQVKWMACRDYIHQLANLIQFKYPSINNFTYSTYTCECQYEAYNDSRSHCVDIDIKDLIVNLQPFNYAREILNIFSENDDY